VLDDDGGELIGSPAASRAPGSETVVGMEAPDLRTTMTPSPSRDDRLMSFGTQLIDMHAWLREELLLLREDVDSYLDGHGTRPRDLLAHCLTFCSALTEHHTGEDSGAFPVLAADVPELAPVLAKLTQDHHVVTTILHNLENLVDRCTATPDPAEARRLRAELEGLAAVLETHFTYEEKQLVTALNSLTTRAGADAADAIRRAVTLGGRELA
jgi:hemerythrin-like domain-containing protein